MKILMVNKFNFLCGGTERYLFDLNDFLTKKGHKIITFSTADKQNNPSKYSSYFKKNKYIPSLKNISLSHKIKSSLDFIYSIESKKKLTHLIKQTKPDIAHIHNIYHHLSTSVIGTLKEKKIPIIMTVHDYKLICPNYSLFTNGEYCDKCKKHKYYNAITHKCLKESYIASSLACLEMYFCKLLKTYEKNISLFIAPSRFVQKKLTGFGINKNKIHYLPHSIDLTLFGSSQPTGDYLLYFGKLEEKKGIDILLKAAKTIPGIRIKIAGSGTYEKELKKISQSENLENIDFLGHKGQKDLAAIVKNALLVIVPSLWPEPFGLTIYEAFTASKCVVASNIGAIPEIIKDNKTGILFSPGNYKELSDKIKMLIANKKRIYKIGKNAKEEINNINNPGKHTRELVNLYQQAIGNNMPLY